MTHIGHSEKVLVMRVFIAVLVLIFSLQSWTKAEGIRDFEIEGMSIGDSLLDFFNEERIISEIKDATFYPSSKKFMILNFNLKKTQVYDDINFHIKDNDKNYIIHSVKGMSYKETNECLKIKKEVVKEVESMVPNAKKSVHTSDYGGKMGKSKAYVDDFYLEGGVIRVFCTAWDKDFMKKKYNQRYEDTLSVNATSSELADFIQDEAYN